MRIADSAKAIKQNENYETIIVGYLQPLQKI